MTTDARATGGGQWGPVSVSPKTGRGFKVETSPGRMRPCGLRRRRQDGRETKAVFGRVQGPGGPGGAAGEKGGKRGHATFSASSGCTSLRYAVCLYPISIFLCDLCVLCVETTPRKKGTGKKGTCYFFGGNSGDRHFRPPSCCLSRPLGIPPPRRRRPIASGAFQRRDRPSRRRGGRRERPPRRVICERRRLGKGKRQTTMTKARPLRFGRGDTRRSPLASPQAPRPCSVILQGRHSGTQGGRSPILPLRSPRPLR